MPNSPITPATAAYLEKFNELLQTMLNDSAVNVTDSLFIVSEVAVRTFGGIHAVAGMSARQAVGYVHEVICPGVATAHEAAMIELVNIRARRGTAGKSV